MSKRRLKNRKLLTEINVIPYVDVSLVLLVIFMVATPFMIQGIDLDLPKTEAQALNKSKDDNLTISISKEGFYSFDLGKKNEINNTLKTGDIGFVDKRGLIYITGRKKRILI